ncbi:MAG TPA: M28 family metallopeptidase [Terriglobales bacterium]|nr:M28 family metallopeptidase [Terriglobales bacterium]
MRKPAILLFTLILGVAAFAQTTPTGPHKPAPAPEPAKAAGPGSSLPASAQAAMKAIDPNHIKAHIRFLASDLLEGRGTGQRGGDIAAEYIATQFQAYGLRPAGDNGSYFQKVPMVGIATEPTSTVSLALPENKSMDLKLGDEVVAMDETQQPSSEVDADLVFVGYGIDAPEYKWNDYKDADVKGKVLLMLVNEPPSDDPNFFKGKALTYYGRWTYKYEEAARKGAVGAIIIHKTDMASYGWDVVRNSWGGERSYLVATGEPKLKLASWVQLAIAKQIADASGKNLDQLMELAKSRDFKPIALPIKVKAHMISHIRPFDSQNVLAILPGSDPKLKDQAVIYSAHYDHLGIHPNEKGDNIYNGAIDNASGCAVLLEMARAFSLSTQKPKRSILFASVTGEEQGLLGSEYLGEHPPIPAGDITLGLNFDGVAPEGIPEAVQVSGADRTTFYPTVQETAHDFGFQIEPDSNPGAGYYYRSDHFSLARVGVPAFSVSEGIKFKGHPKEWGLEQEKLYNEKHYHQPSDEYQDNWDFTGVAEIVRFGFDLGWKAASQPDRIAWKHGDEFEAARKASLRQMGASAIQ